MSNESCSKSKSAQEKGNDILEVLRLVSSVKISLQDSSLINDVEEIEKKIKCMWLEVMTDHLERMLFKSFIMKALNDADDQDDNSESDNKNKADVEDDSESDNKESDEIMELDSLKKDN